MAKRAHYPPRREAATLEDMNAAIKQGKSGKVRGATVRPVRIGSKRELRITDEKGKQIRVALSDEAIAQIKGTF